MHKRDHNIDPQSVLAEKMGVTAFSPDRENVVGGSDFSDDLVRQDDILRWNPELYAMEFVSDKNFIEYTRTGKVYFQQLKYLGI
mgnify:CR=1 FL=1